MLDRVLKRVLIGLFIRLFGWLFSRLLGWLFYRVPMTAGPAGQSVLTARSRDRAVSFWGALSITLAALACAEANATATLVTAMLVPAIPIRTPPLLRLILVVAALSTSWFGPVILILAIPLAFVVGRYSCTGLSAAIALVAVALGSHHIEALPSPQDMPVHLGSLAALALPATVAALILARWLARAGIAWTIGVMVLVLGSLLLGSEIWFGPSIVSDPSLRVLLAALPAAIGGWQGRPREERPLPRLALLAIPVGAAFSLLMPAAPITTVVFDETHGQWETVRAHFGPDDFGRGVNYTYSLLANYAGRIADRVSTLDDEADQLPGHDAVLVIKMPIERLGDRFVERVVTWVREGGRLLVVADHTDLYNSTQNLNGLLGRFGYQVNSEAVYDATGLPNVPVTDFAAGMLGRLDAYGFPVAWQTGASLGRKPANALRLATFGPSFSEPGDYSRQNRFGPFVPRMGLRFIEHTAIAGSGFGKGAIGVVLDSTPWSNFALFKEPYRRLFFGLVFALSHPLALMLAGWGTVALGAIAVIVTLAPFRVLLIPAGLALGVILGATSQIGAVSIYAPVESRDFGLRVVAGGAARFEFLKQLVGPGERNYARIVSAMAKYDLIPLASEPGFEIPRLDTSKRWLLLEPDDGQLPDAVAIIEHLRRGGDLTVLLAPDAAARPAVREWLADLLLTPQRATGLAMAEDARPGGFFARRGPAVLRDSRTVVVPLPTSLLKEREADTLLQSFTSRPTTFPRTSGIFTIGFSADQFADDAVGEVWDGVRPSVLGQHRERQLSAILLGKDLPPPVPDIAALPKPDTPEALRLVNFVMFENGRKVLEGKLDDEQLRHGPDISVSEAPLAYLADLRARAVSFVQKSCSTPGKVCSRHLIGADMVEWLVSWAAGDDGRPSAIELVHERRFSGMESTWNIVFGE